MRASRVLPLLCLLAAMGCSAPALVTDDPLRTVAQGSPPAIDDDKPPTTAPALSDAPTPIEFGATSGSLVPWNTPVDDRGHYVRSYVIDAPPGELLRVRLSSDRFDTWLRMELPDGRVLENDDFGGSTNSRLQVELRDGGAVRIDVTTYGIGASGPYTLEIDALNLDKIGILLDADDHPNLTLRPGQRSDPDIDGVAHIIEAEAGQRLRVRVTSPDFDTVATLLSPEGHRWENDDAHDLGPDGTESALDSTIEAVAPLSGRYLLYVRSYGGNGGTYRVQVARSDAPIVRDGEETPRGGFAGANAAGRVYGVFVGISAYTSSPLPHCADDARFIGEAFRKRRLASTNDIRILTDTEATRANVERAVADILPRVGPDDLFFFFFSGHGATVPADGRGIVELNGLDETMELYDGALLDHDFAALFDRSTAGTLLLAMDSCHAGGFARDFVDRPGRIGLFSSDEDVLSLTADSLQSGGYLSWSLLRGILGAADRRPTDGALLLGELTDYLVDAYATYHAMMNTNSVTGRHQRLVIQRGSVDWGTLLWMQPRDAEGALPLPIDDPVHGVQAATQRGLCSDGSCLSGGKADRAH